jgi:type I restriction enzyme, S subunit
MNEVKNIPILRFPEFNEVWNQFKLKDVSKYSNGGSFENDVNEHGRYELVTLKSINTEGNLVSSGRYIDKDVKTLQEGTLVMILSEQAPGLLGMTAIIPCDNKYVLNQRVAEIRPTNEINSFFLSSVINVNQRYFSKHGAGMKVQNISKPNVEKFEFYIPSLYEQQKIGDFLTLVDKRIDLLKKKKTLLETYKKGVMKKIFNQEI